jgi:hypothetical protein
MGSEARRSKVFSWQRSAHARDLVLKMKRDYFRELHRLKTTSAEPAIDYIALRVMYIMLNEMCKSCLAVLV